MRSKDILNLVTVIAAIIVLSSGCSYSTTSLLPSNLKTIHVDNFENKIKIDAEQSNMRMYRGYRPGMEAEITKVIINKFLFDGNLSVSRESNADLVLKGELIDYKRDTIRYGTNDTTEEYRIKLIINMKLIETKTGKTMWEEKSFTGETTYRTGGQLVKTEDEAVRDAEDDLARRVVERTIEAW